jgi:hypothetical protein
VKLVRVIGWRSEGHGILYSSPRCVYFSASGWDCCESTDQLVTGSLSQAGSSGHLAARLEHCLTYQFPLDYLATTRLPPFNNLQVVWILLRGGKRPTHGGKTQGFLEELQWKDGL